MNFLAGYKTNIIGTILILKGIAAFLLPDAGISPDPSGDIQMGLVALGLRAAIK